MSEGAGRGKVILFGEHAVVHGAPALVVGLDRGARALAARSRDPAAPRHTLNGAVVARGSALERAFSSALAAAGAPPSDLDVTSELPPGGGLGSSAAIGVAIARALGAPEPDVERVALAFERIFHGNPSGVDVAAAARGGVLRFVRGQPPTACAVGAPLSLCVGLTGKGGSTREMVERVASFADRDPPRLRRFVEGAGALTEAAIGFVAAGALAELGAAMGRAHELLREVEVSTPELDRLVALAVAAGALGAKLTGAGGGGSVVALAAGAEEAVLEAWRGAGFSGFGAVV